jgi:signal transduction histidine kinase
MERNANMLQVVTEGEPGTMQADRTKLRQTLLNLLSNAAKFTRTTAAVDVSLDDGVVRVDVRDDGPGIDASDQQIIFEKFRQGDDSSGQRPQGTGLGLPISRQIVEHLGGSLWVESEPGRGSTFSFTLPLAHEEQR